MWQDTLLSWAFLFFVKQKQFEAEGKNPEEGKLADFNVVLEWFWSVLLVFIDFQKSVSGFLICWLWLGRNLYKSAV